MYNRLTRFFLLLILISTTPFALMAQSDLSSILSEVSDQLGTVNAKKYTYDQTWTSDSNEPNKITVTFVQTDTKGRSEQEEYAFNLADIDDKTIRYRSQKDLILVELKTKGNQRFIKKWTDGELQNYSNGVTLVASDIENARSIQQKLKEAVKLSRELIKDRLQLSGYEDMVKWLEDNVKGGEVEDQSFVYNWKQDAQLDSRFELTLDESNAKSAKQSVYGFNLGDFNANAVNMMIKGKFPYVEIRTDGKTKYISVIEDGEPGNYSGTIQIYSDEIEKARNIETVLKQIIPLAKDKLKAQLPSFGSGSEALGFLSNAIGDVSIGNDSYQQSMTNDCKATVKVIESDEKGNSKEQVYDLNLGDLNPGRTQIKISGNTVGLSLETNNKNRYIQVYRDGEQQNYASDFEIVTDGIESARFLKEAFSPAIEECKAQLSANAPTSADAALSFVQEKLETIDDGKGNSLDQSLVKIEGDPCKLEYTQVINTTKSSNDRLYEIILADLNPNSLTLKVSGKEIFVEVETKAREKIIKAYENGEVEPYASKVSWQYNNLEPARNSMMAIETLIEGCAN